MKPVLTLRNQMVELPRLLAFASDFAHGANLSNQDLSRLLIIIDELFSNVVLHGYDGPEIAGSVSVGLSCVDGMLEIEVADDGRAFDPLQAPAPDFDLPATERPIGGLGIHFVRQLVDDAQYLREGQRNRLLLRRRVHRAAASAQS